MLEPGKHQRITHGRARGGLALPACVASVLLVTAGTVLLLPAGVESANTTSGLVKGAVGISGIERLDSPAVRALGSSSVSNYAKVGSSNWSGYAQHTTRAGTFTAVEDTWIVPRIVSGKSGTEIASDWVGVGGYGDSSLVQAGTTEENSNGIAHYSAWTEVLPQAAVTIAGLAIRAGDRIETQVEETSAGVWKMTVSDLTTKKSGGRTVRYKSSGESAEAIHERPKLGTGLSNLAATGNVTFYSGEYSTASPGHEIWEALLKATTLAQLAAIFMTTGTKIIASPSAPSSNGLAFSVADGSSAPPTPAWSRYT